MAADQDPELDVDNNDQPQSSSKKKSSAAEVREWIDVASKVILTFVALVVGWHFSFQKQQNDDTKIIADLLSSDDGAKSVLGGTLANVYSDSKSLYLFDRIPDDFYLSVIAFANRSNNALLRATINRNVDRIF